MNDQWLPVFVYGTLKQGEERAPLWPHPPERIETAWTRGRLYDLRLYPALTPGEDRVQGELWHLRQEHLPATLAALDEIEGAVGEGRILYVRVQIDCLTLAGETVRAHAYHYADLPGLQAYPRLLPNAEGICRWSAALLG